MPFSIRVQVKLAPPHPAQQFSYVLHAPFSMAAALGYDGDEAAADLYSNVSPTKTATAAASSGAPGGALKTGNEPPKHSSRGAAEEDRQHAPPRQHQPPALPQQPTSLLDPAPAPAPPTNGVVGKFHDPEANPEFNTSNQTTGFVAATQAGFKYSVDKDEYNPCKLFVGNLLWTTTVEGVQSYFSQFGDVEDCKIMTDKYTNQSRGFGFVAFREEECTLTQTPHFIVNHLSRRAGR